MFVLLDDQATRRQLYFTQPVRVLTHRMGEPVDALFRQIEAAQAEGLWIAGHFAYEFGAALELKLSHSVAPGTELVRLGVFHAPSDHPPASLLYRAAPPQVTLKPEWSEAQYTARFEAVQRYLRAGDAYQINLTFPMRGRMEDGLDAGALYAGFRRRQPGRHGAVVSLGGPDIVSFSPELFFERRGNHMRMRPMKGTRPKASPGENVDDMTVDAKSRAENLMIVDLLRNDLSRLSRPGSVKVPELFTVEDYPTLVQMTSQVTSELCDGTSWREIFAALFPCGSVTGAPKIRAMEIIHELESGPRGAYCGAVGFIAPEVDGRQGEASFSVAIRTAVIDKGDVRYDVGSGVVLDSDAGDEYRECLLKADILSPAPPGRFETVRNGPDGVVRAGRHAARLDAEWPYIAPTTFPQRVRIDRHSDGRITQSAQPLNELSELIEPLSLAVSRYALNDAVQRTDIKTSHRDFYDGERARIHAACGADEVLFMSSDDHEAVLREGSFTTLFVRIGDRLLTPRTPGILPGVLRAELIDDGTAFEGDITLDDLMAADAVFVGNSLRGLMRARLQSSDPV